MRNLRTEWGKEGDGLDGYSCDEQWNWCIVRRYRILYGYIDGCNASGAYMHGVFRYCDA